MIKVGIITFYSSINYGAYLQAYALCEMLNQETDISAELIQLQMHEEIKHYRSLLKPRKNVFAWVHNYRRHRMFLKQQKKLRVSQYPILCGHADEVAAEIENMEYDCLVAGSDEIWQIDGIRGYPTPYFLLWESSAKKLAYAVSGRTRFQNLPAGQYSHFVQNLFTFQYIGARDETTYSSVKETGFPEAYLHRNLDPTLVYDFSPNRERGRKILLGKYHVDISKKCIGVMFAEHDPRRPDVLGYLKAHTDCDTQFVCLFEWIQGGINTPTLTPFEWIDVIAALDCVVTMFFHACCFSILAHTPLYAIEQRAKSKEQSKIYDLLKQFDLLDYYSLGTKEAIESGRLLHTVMESNTIHWDCDERILEGRKCFDEFVDVLRG